MTMLKNVTSLQDIGYPELSSITTGKLLNQYAAEPDELDDDEDADADDDLDVEEIDLDEEEELDVDESIEPTEGDEAMLDTDLDEEDTDDIEGGLDDDDDDDVQQPLA